MVTDGREAGVLWKQLAWSLGRSREQLHRLAARHAQTIQAEKCNTAAVEPPERAVA